MRQQPAIDASHDPHADVHADEVLSLRAATGAPLSGGAPSLSMRLGFRIVP